MLRMRMYKFGQIFYTMSSLKAKIPKSSSLKKKFNENLMSSKEN